MESSHLPSNFCINPTILILLKDTVEFTIRQRNILTLCLLMCVCVCVCVRLCVYECVWHDIRHHRSLRRPHSSWLLSLTRIRRNEPLNTTRESENPNPHDNAFLTLFVCPLWDNLFIFYINISLLFITGVSWRLILWKDSDWTSVQRWWCCSHYNAESRTSEPLFFESLQCELFAWRVRVARCSERETKENVSLWKTEHELCLCVCVIVLFSLYE